MKWVDKEHVSEQTNYIISIKIFAGAKTMGIFDKQGETYICKEEYIVTIDFY